MLILSDLNIILYISFFLSWFLYHNCTFSLSLSYFFCQQQQQQKNVSATFCGFDSFCWKKWALKETKQVFRFSFFRSPPNLFRLSRQYLSASGFFIIIFRPLFLDFRSFQYNRRYTNVLHITVCRWLDSNRGPLVLNAAALSTEPQPLPLRTLFNVKFTIQKMVPLCFSRNEFKKWDNKVATKLN